MYFWKNSTFIINFVIAENVQEMKDSPRLASLKGITKIFIHVHFLFAEVVRSILYAAYPLI